MVEHRTSPRADQVGEGWCVMASLRKRIDQHCKSCVYDPLAAGSWRQQVTLCCVKSCAFHDVRPKTSYPIPESVLSCYGVNLAESQALEDN
jgi:hypothetical protein